MAHSWKRDRAAEHIAAKIKDVKKVEIVDFTREMSLGNIPAAKAYRMEAVHLYADILNLDDMLNCTSSEGETCHKRTLRFLDLHGRSVRRILNRADALRVDFHNQRLHAVVHKPYDSDDDEDGSAEARRLHRAVAIAQLIIDVCAATGDDDAYVPAARVRVGIDSGLALVVNNGRNGGREPLFLGDPANHAAKFSAAGSTVGIFLTNNARRAIGLPEVKEPSKTKLTTSEVALSQADAELGLDVEDLAKEWRTDLAKNPLSNYGFSRHTPPLRTIDIVALTPSNSRRQEAVSVYADIDGFTAYVARHLEAGTSEDVVRALHVIRAELDRVLGVDFEGRRVRFIGDCVHGLLCEGTARTTDDEETVSTAVLCAGALRSSFELALEKLDEEGVDVKKLGLAIGIEFGPMTLTRLGAHGDRLRCSVSRGVLVSESEQKRCTGKQTAIGQVAYDSGTQAVRDLFGLSRRFDGLDYNEAVEGLAADGDRTAKAIKAEAFAAAAPAVKRASDQVVTPYVELGGE
ncbi:transcriptional regulator [Methylobacterium sp. J-072]|uniref:adenylate/guanylate cyclase domain-containing protein n=1 Tax=Methylobacterium sp. J-072 TaxID=2836651 RepID=UPI001FB9C717|nr:adenylate/guanylate cyclase domain-containing protein [Methylobacterium sp. J-072]MCJ2096308.1 transcriptional regulator [Methylobacterium sp. J-072]